MSASRGESPHEPPQQAPPQPWVAERDVDAESALALIRHAFPDLHARQVESFGAGWDNTAWLLDGTWVFRFPRRTLAVELLLAETRVLPRLAPLLPLPVPVPEFLGEPTERFPWPFAGYRMLQGRTACRAQLDAKARMALAEPLARFLSVLHGLPEKLLTDSAAPPDTLDRLELPRRRAAIETRLAEAVQAELIDDASPWLDVLAALPDVWHPRTGHLIHGDLYARHLLLDDNDAPVGVIDWGDVHLDEPATDLALAYSLLPAAARGRFFEVYGDVDEVTHAMARFRALLSAVTILVYGHDIGDDDLRREGRLGLDHLLQDARDA